MLELRAFFAVCLVTTLTGSVVAAPTTREPDSGLAMRELAGTGHLPQVDGPVTTLTAVDGRTFAAWAYRASREFDIAVSARDASSGTWGEPVFFGRGNGADDLEPALTIDTRGTAYVAFTMTNPSRVALTTLSAGSDVWSEPVLVSGSDRASSPELLVVGERLIVAFRTSRGVGLVNLPIVGGDNQINGIQDGPEGSDPLGYRGNQNLPANSWSSGSENPNP